LEGTEADRIAGVELVGIALPVQTDIRDLIQHNQLIVAWDSEDRLHAKLLQAFEDVPVNGDLRHGARLD
jgi:hypothetical protein